MRKHQLLFSLFCFIASLASSQNWNAFTSGRTYHYKSDTATALPDQSIHFDSVQVLGLDSSLSVARRFVFPVDTSQRNQPMFIGRDVRVTSGGVFNFKNPHNIALPTQSSVGTMFVLDSISGLTATLTHTGMRNVLTGAVDSVKVFVTMALDSLVLSKAHGIVEWPSSLGGSRFRLSGIQEVGVGELLPGFDGFMDMPSGADYYYESHLTEGDLIEQTHVFRVRFHVDTAQRVGSGIQYGWHGIVREEVYLGGNLSSVNITQPNNTFLIEDRANSLLKKSHTEQLRAPGALLGLAFPEDFATFRKSAGVDTSLRVWDGLWTTMTYEMNGTAKELHYGRSNGAVGWLYYGIGGDSCAASNLEQIRTVFREGFGIVHAEWATMFQSGEFDLVGSIINGDTNGTVFDDAILLARHDAAPVALGLQVAPNPTRGPVQVMWADAKPGVLQVMDLQGRICWKGETHGLMQSVDLGGLPAGMYLLRLQQGGRDATVRLVLGQ